MLEPSFYFTIKIVLPSPTPQSWLSSITMMLMYWSTTLRR